MTSIFKMTKERKCLMMVQNLYLLTCPNSSSAPFIHPAYHCQTDLYGKLISFWYSVTLQLSGFPFKKIMPKFHGMLSTPSAVVYIIFCYF